jgi:uncharacterized membrane protein HdeD (DUF308 family)
MTGDPIHHRAGPAPEWPEPVERPGDGAQFWGIVALGGGAVLFGLLVLAWPEKSVRVLGALTGVWLLVAGAVRVVQAFARWRGVGAQVLSGITGVLFMLLGVACVRDVLAGVTVLAFVISLAWLLVGTVELIGASSGGPARAWRIVLGVAALLSGLAFLLWPGPSVGVLVLFGGIASLVLGGVAIAVAVQLRRAR